jgi:hypothetical protein
MVILCFNSLCLAEIRNMSGGMTVQLPLGCSVRLSGLHLCSGEELHRSESHRGFSGKSHNVCIVHEKM